MMNRSCLFISLFIILIISGCGGGGATSPPESIEPPVEESQPGVLSAKAVSSSEIQLAWSDIDSERTDPFNIYQSTEPGLEEFDSPNYTVAGGELSYLVAGLSANSRYCFVVCEGSPGKSTCTIEACATTTPVPAKTHQLGKNGFYTVGSVPTLTWSAVEDADSYHIQISTNAGFTAIVADELVEASELPPSFTPEALKPWSYWWRVRACSGEHCSEWTDNVYRFYYRHAPGDIDGDGIAELVVSSYQHNGTVGRVYIFRGREVWPSENIDAGAADRIIDGEVAGDYTTVSYYTGTFDANGDGYADFVITRYSPPALKIFLGGPHFFDTTSGTVADADVTVEGGVDKFCSYTIGGDINGDGFGDLIGQLCYYPDDLYYGRVAIYFGEAAFGDQALLTVGDAAIIMDGYSYGWEAFGISNLADLDNDGRLDLVGIESDWTGDETWLGRASFFYSNETFLSSSALTVDDAASYIEGLIGMDGFLMESMGDWNGDGKTDLLGSAYDDFSASHNVGLLYRGGSIIPLENGSIPATDADLTLRALDEGDYFVRNTVTGDFDNDGIDDIAIDEMYAGPSGEGSEGIVYFYRGGELFDATGDVGPEAASLKVYGGGSGNNFGYIAGKTAMDINGDGIGDLIFSGSRYTDRCVEPPVSYGRRSGILIFLGRDDFFGYHQAHGTQWSCEADIKILGEAAGDELGSISTMIP